MTKCGITDVQFLLLLLNLQKKPLYYVSNITDINDAGYQA